MCLPDLRARLAANPDAVSTNPGSEATGSNRSPAVRLAAFPRATAGPPLAAGPTAVPRAATNDLADRQRLPILVQGKPPRAAPSDPVPAGRDRLDAIVPQIQREQSRQGATTATLASPKIPSDIEAQPTISSISAPSPAPVPSPTRGRSSPPTRSRAMPRPDILTGSRYDGLRGSDLDAALEDTYRNQQAIDAQAEWNATLGRITRDYQAPDDPDGRVYVPDKIWPPWKLGLVTAKERRLILQLPIRAGISGWGQFHDVRQHAVDMTGSFIGLPTPEQVPPKVRDYILRTDPGNLKKWVDLWRNTDGHSDAFRHAYWNALIAKAFGPVFTQAYGAAHEGGPGNPKVSEAMDLFNNEVGRTIASDHPDASEQQLAVLVRDALRKGKLVVIDQNGRLAWSNKVKWAEHGLTPPAPGSIRGGKIFPMAGDSYLP